MTADNKAVDIATKIILCCPIGYTGGKGNKMKKNYTFFVDSYGTDALGCACVKTKKITVKAKSDRGAKQIARNRKDVSRIVDDAGKTLTVTTSSGEYPYSTSRYCVGC